MRRREFIRLGGGVAATAVFSPLATRAQQRMRRVGVLSAFDGIQGERYFGAFKAGLEALGWVHGRNILIDFRQESDTGHLSTLAHETVGANPDVILAMT